MLVGIVDKRGGEKLLSIWWFFVLGVVGLGITIGVLIFYGAGINVKGLEAQTFSDRVTHCLSNGANLNEVSLSLNFDLLSYCNIDKAQYTLGGDYFYEIEISGIDPPLYFSGGAPSIKTDCKVASLVKTKDYPECISTTKTLYYKGNELKMEIFSASNNVGEKISSAE